VQEVVAEVSSKASVSSSQDHWLTQLNGLNLAWVEERAGLRNDHGGSCD